MDLKEDQVEQMRSLFAMVDKDGDGMITVPLLNLRKAPSCRCDELCM